MSTIFISYASQDREIARDIAARLEAHDHRVWWDRTIPPGRVFDEVIQEALAAAQCVVVLWSSHSVRSNWVKVEAEEAAARGLLVPVLIERVTPPIQFKRIQAANLSEWRGDENDPEFRGLLAAIQHLLGRPVTAVAPQPVIRAAPRSASTVRTVAWSVGTTLALVALVAFVMLYRGPAAQDPIVGETGAVTSQTRETRNEAVADTAPPAPAPRSNTPANNPSAVRRGELINLLSPENGGELITAKHAEWARTVDGNESTGMWQNESEAVFGFKDGRLATVEAVEILIKGTDQYNVSELEVATSTVGPDGPFTSPEVARTRNLLIVKERYQRTSFTPRTARYVRVRLSKSHSTSAPSLEEWRLLGTLQ